MMTTSKQTTPTTPATLPLFGYVRLSVLMTFIPLSASIIWRRSRAGTFPKPYKISENATGWKVEEIMEWQASIEAKGG